VNNLKISEAKNARNKIDVKAIVLKKSDPRVVNKKDGTTTKVCDFQISDESGEITLSLWGDEIDRVKEGSRIEVNNGYTNSFKGKLSLSVGKFGRLIVN
jgi:replication factor A1